jgi:hypothetical protein
MDIVQCANIFVKASTEDKVEIKFLPGEINDWIKIALQETFGYGSIPNHKYSEGGSVVQFTMKELIKFLRMLEIILSEEEMEADERTQLENLASYVQDCFKLFQST